MEHLQPQGESQIVQHLLRAVGAAIIDHDDLGIHRQGLHAGQHAGNGPLLVVDRNDHRELEAKRHLEIELRRLVAVIIR
jgi:hypothetical protein